MMDDNSNSARESEATFDIDAWISELMPHVVESSAGNDNGMEETNINILSAYVDDLTNKAVNMDEGLCENATTKSDMIPNICQDSKSMDSNSGLIQATKDEIFGQVSHLQNLPVCSEDRNSLLRRDMAPSTLPNANRELSRIQGSQLAVPELQQSQKVQQPVAQPSLIHSNIHYGYQKQQQQQSMKLSQLRSLQQPISTASQDMWLRWHLYNPSILQPRPQPSMANCALEKLQPSALQHMAPSNRQPQELQNNAFELMQQQRSNSGPASHKMKRHQQPLDILGCSEYMASQQNFQQASQPMQFSQWRSTGSLCDILPHGMQKKMQTSSSHPQSLVIGNEPKPIELPRNTIQEAFSDSTTQNELPNQSEWHDHAYQQLQSMKEIYLAELIKMHRTTQELCLQPPNAASAMKYERTRTFLEKSIRFLHIPRGDLVHVSKEKVYSQMDFITRYIYQVRMKNPVSGQHRQPLPQSLGSPSKTTAVLQKGNTSFQFSLSNAGSAPTAISTSQLVARQGAVNLQVSQRYSSQDSSLPALGNADASEIDPLQRNLVRFTQQNALRSAQPSNMIICPNRSSQNGLEGVHDTLSTPQRASSSLRNTLSALDSTIRSVPCNSTVVQSQNFKHWEEHQMMQAQKMKQPLHQPLIDQNNKRMMVLRSENNDLKFGQAVNFSPRIRQQHHQVGRQTNHTSHTLLSSSSYQQHHVASPQNSQSSVQQVDVKDLSSKQSRAATPSQSSGSPFIVPSPLTPLTPSSTQVDHEKSPSGSSPLAHADNVAHSKASVPSLQHKSQALDRNNFLAIDIAGAANSHLPKESAEQEDSQQEHSKRDPFIRLIEAVKLASPEALSASVRDIDAVINIIDSRAGTLLYRELRDTVGEDLADDLSNWEKENLTMEHGNASEKRMKRNFNSLPYETLPPPSCGRESFKKLSEQKSDSESTSISQLKQLKTKANDLLLREIKEINKHLVETSVDVVQDSADFSRYGADKRTIVRCSYVALGQFAASHIKFPNLLVRLLVTSEYPNSSPQVLDASPHGSSENEEVKGISEKAMSKFSLSLRKFSDPISLSDMAKAWDVCARELFREYAKHLGGDCFSSRYGTWENCVVAA